MYAKQRAQPILQPALIRWHLHVRHLCGSIAAGSRFTCPSPTCIESGQRGITFGSTILTAADLCAPLSRTWNRSSRNLDSSESIARRYVVRVGLEPYTETRTGR